MCAGRLAGAATPPDGPHRLPLSVATTFLHPVRAGDAQAQLEIVATSRSLTTIHAELVQDRRLAVIQTALFGSGYAEREPDRLRPDLGPPMGLEPSATLSADVSQQVHRHVDWRCATPWQSELDAWITHRAVPRLASGELDPAWIIAATDVLGPAVAGSAPFYPFYTATVTLYVQLFAHTSSAWLQQRIRGALAGSNAYGTVDLWDEDGRLIAVAHQHAVLLPAAAGDLPFCITGFGWGRPTVGTGGSR